MIYIYALVDPIDEKTAYVGKTKYLSSRYKAHLKDNINRFKMKWIKRLLKQRKFPLIYVLEQTDGRRCKSCEKFWIDKLPSLGFELTNVLHMPDNRKYYSGLRKAASRRHKREMKLWLVENNKPHSAKIITEEDKNLRKTAVRPVANDSLVPTRKNFSNDSIKILLETRLAKVLGINRPRLKKWGEARSLSLNAACLELLSKGLNYNGLEQELSDSKALVHKLTKSLYEREKELDDLKRYEGDYESLRKTVDSLKEMAQRNGIEI